MLHPLQVRGKHCGQIHSRPQSGRDLYVLGCTISYIGNLLNDCVSKSLREKLCVIRSRNNNTEVAGASHVTAAPDCSGKCSDKWWCRRDNIISRVLETSHWE